MIPVEYGEGLADRLRVAAPHGIEAFVALFGAGYVRLAVDLGFPPDPRRHHRLRRCPRARRADGLRRGLLGDRGAVLRELADLAPGAVELPIAATHPLERVTDAFEELERRHTLGKIVLLP